jgi:hypothetical protein
MNIDDIDRLSHLEPGVLILIGLELNLSELFNLCLANKALNNKLCLNRDLWYRKLFRDFGFYYNLTNKIIS